MSAEARRPRIADEPDLEAALARDRRRRGLAERGPGAPALERRPELTARPRQIVEIGSFRGRSTIVLSRAVAEGIQIVAIDPHGGGDRGPQEIAPEAERGNADNESSSPTCSGPGSNGRRAARAAMSDEAHGDVDGSIDLLYVDGAHRYAPARDDIAAWGARVPLGGTLLVHDAYNAIGVMLAQLRLLFFSGRGATWAARARSRSTGARTCRPGARAANALRQAVHLPYFVRNGLIKLALVARLRPVARLLGQPDEDAWPY